MPCSPFYKVLVVVNGSLVLQQGCSREPRDAKIHRRVASGVHVGTQGALRQRSQAAVVLGV